MASNSTLSSLLCCDALGTTVGIRYKGYNRTRTVFGGVMSILMILITLVTVSFFGHMYISGSEISMMNNVFKFWNSQNITLTEDFKIAFSNQYAGKQMLRDDLWSISAEYVKYNSTNRVMNSTTINLEKCNINNWSKAESQFKQLKMEDALCLNTTGLDLRGNYNTELFEFTRITFTLVPNLTDPVINTLLDKEIGELMPLATLFMLEGVTQLDKKKFIDNYFINAINVNLTFRNIKDIEVAISEDEVQMSNDKIILSETITNKHYVAASVTEKISVRPTAFKKSLSFIILSSNKKNVSTISFMSFSEMLARIGAIVQNILTICMLVSYLKTYWTCEHDHLNDILARMCDDHKRCAGKYATNVDKMIHMDKTNIINSQNEGMQKESQLSEMIRMNSQDNDGINYNVSINLDKLALKDQEVKNSQASQNSSNKAVVNKPDDKSSNILNINKSTGLKTYISKSEKKQNRQEKKLNLNKDDLYDSISMSVNPLRLKPDVTLIKELLKNMDQSGNANFTFGSYFYNKYISSFGSIRLFNFCCKKSINQSDLFFFINNYLNSALEVYGFEKRYFQFELLKYILLNTQQIELFEKIPFIAGNGILKQIEIIQEEKVLKSRFTNTLKELADQDMKDKKLYGLYINSIEN